MPFQTVGEDAGRHFIARLAGNADGIAQGGGKRLVARDEFGHHVFGGLRRGVLRFGMCHQARDRSRRICPLNTDAFSDFVQRAPEVLILRLEQDMQLTEIRSFDIPVIAVGLHIQAEGLSQNVFQGRDVGLGCGGHRSLS